MSENGNYYRRGLGLKAEVKPVLKKEYGSAVIEAMKASDYRLEVGRLTFRLARSLGFCYGVDRAVEYAYETCRKFPDRRIWLVGEIIHNPLVNSQLESMGVTFLYPDEDGDFDFTPVEPADVVILPAFGVSIDAFQRLRDLDCVLIDTTCGSVLHVWKRVESYARDGFTSLVHGKYRHEETRATSSQALRYEGGSFLIVRDMDEALLICDFIRGDRDAAEIRSAFEGKTSEGFDPETHLQRIGVANQTTMLATESLEIARVVGEAIRDRWGEDEFPDRFRSFDTICSATQDRQDAVLELMQDRPDLMVVVGGYNSSNTTNLARICAQHVPTYHIEADGSIDPERGVISHRQVDTGDVVEESGWLPEEGTLEIGLTAGASTPDSLIGRTVRAILETFGEDPELALAASTTVAR
ncbi:MAG: 4-hydroxy-3-methylbut-2-enyl diphosphate reductase [marine benthic group bacterium]|nr:4-hydroxy-3-methylbut-2-enyl diphosphate reductase [Candidatus Carthagonibacter metallireducens]